MKKRIKSWNGNPQTEPDQLIEKYRYRYTDIIKKEELKAEMNIDKIRKIFKDEFRNLNIKVSQYNDLFYLQAETILNVVYENEDTNETDCLEAEFALDDKIENVIYNKILNN